MTGRLITYMRRNSHGYEMHR